MLAFCVRGTDSISNVKVSKKLCVIAWAGVVPLNSDVIVSNKQYDKSFLGLIIKKLFLKFAKLRNGIDCSFNLHFH